MHFHISPGKQSIIGYHLPNQKHTFNLSMSHISNDFIPKSIPFDANNKFGK